MILSLQLVTYLIKGFRVHQKTTSHLTWECKISKKWWNMFFSSNVSVFVVGNDCWSNTCALDCSRKINPKED